VRCKLISQKMGGKWLSISHLPLQRFRAKNENRLQLNRFPFYSLPRANLISSFIDCFIAEFSLSIPFDHAAGSRFDFDSPLHLKDGQNKLINQ
jgi:hypothetical protein